MDKGTVKTTIKNLVKLGWKYYTKDCGRVKFNINETEIGIVSAYVVFEIPVDVYGQESHLELTYKYSLNPETEILILTFVNGSSGKRTEVYHLRRLANMHGIVKVENIWKVAKQVCDDYREYYNQ